MVCAGRETCLPYRGRFVVSDPCTSTERSGLIVYLFCQGGRFTALEVAQRLGITVQASRKLLCGLARVIPIYREDTGVWLLLVDERNP